MPGCGGRYSTHDNPRPSKERCCEVSCSIAGGHSPYLTLGIKGTFWGLHDGEIHGTTHTAFHRPLIAHSLPSNAPIVPAPSLSAVICTWDCPWAV
jgi:hypothetical protein